jgi:MFS family permease
MPLPAAFRALRYRNFQLFFGGQLISLVGTWMQTVAQAWLVYRLTGSSVLLGAVGFAGQIPVLLLGPAGGAIADRYSRHRVVIATQTSAMLLALALAALTLTGTVHIWQIFVLAILLGVVNAFDMPARQSFFVEMVGRTDLMNAIAMNSSIVNISRIVGPAVAGVLVAWIGEGWCFFANGVSYVAVIAGLLMMRVPASERAISEGSQITRVVEGYRFVLRNQAILSLMALLGVISIIAMPYTVLMPIFADRILHGGSEALGMLMGFTGVGALAAALALASRRNVQGLMRWVAVASGSFGVSLVAFAASRSLWLSAAILVPVGFFMMLQLAASNTLVQTMVPDELRGRVMSVHAMMFIGMAPFGSLLAGAAADRIGAPATVACGGVISIIAAAVFWMRLPRIRPDARRLILAQQMAAGDPPQEATGGSVESESRGM